MALDEGGHRTLAEKDLAEMKRSVERLSVDVGGGEWVHSRFPM